MQRHEPSRVDGIAVGAGRPERLDHLPQQHAVLLRRPARKHLRGSQSGRHGQVAAVRAGGGAEAHVQRGPTAVDLPSSRGLPPATRCPDQPPYVLQNRCRLHLVAPETADRIQQREPEPAVVRIDSQPPLHNIPVSSQRCLRGGRNSTLPAYRRTAVGHGWSLVRTHLQ